MYRETSYFYHRDGLYDVTFAYKRAEDHVVCGAAFCNPKDQFSKSMGRMVAEGRLNVGPRINVAISSDATRFQVHDLLVEALSEYPASPDLLKE